jgi:catechol 2,3-dioxygenase-like lactoylglutathione lyase family enzyme
MKLALTALLVHDYDEAIAFFTGTLGFSLHRDEPREPGKRWVVVAPAEGGALLLARAVTDEQRAAVGRQSGGRVGWFLHADDFWADYERLRAAGVRFCEPPRQEVYGWVVVFEDLYGNRWDLLQAPSP